MSETTIPFLAPGCFGSALLFQEKGMVCTACPFKGECEPAHILSLTTMREKLGIKVPPKRHVSAPQTVDGPVEECDERMTLPKKVRELLSRLDREHLDIVGKIKEGVNPFANHDRYRFMQITCHLVMRLQIPVNQKVVSAGLVKSMGWAQGTADAHARMAIQALTHVGAIENNDGILSVKS
jgi:hypothetical protein